MQPDDDALDEEIRGHLALSIKERVERGEDPAAARLAALKEFGNLTLTRDSMRGVWRHRWLDAVEALGRDIRFALRALRRSKGLAATVVVTLALGIGANAAIFSVVKGVLLRPLVNRDEDRLIYIRQSAPGLGAENTTFSVPEIADFKSRVTTISAFGDFSTVEFTIIGLGAQPRIVKAGVVNGSFFEVMGLRPVLGRLLSGDDDGPEAAGVAVLTHRFWRDSLDSDPSVIGKTIRLGARTATVIGVLEPSVPYPADTEIIANVVTSPHHLGATMVTSRTHRMTELFGRLAPGASFEAARAELISVHTALIREHPEAYAVGADVQLGVARLRDQIAAPARTILLVLLGAAAIVFVIACSNVANLILARSVRREGELAVRAALGAGAGALRRTLLAESLLLCGAGAALGILLAQPLVATVASYAARFSVRALEVTVDMSVVWVGVSLALGAAVLLAFVPRLPSAHAPGGLGLASGNIRITPGTHRRLRAFATTQIAFSFVLLAGAGMLLAALVAMQRASTGFNMRQVLVLDVPPAATGIGGSPLIDFYERATRRISELPGVEGVAVGNFVPWRDVGTFPVGFQFAVDGYTPATGEDNPHGRLRIVAPRFFAVLGVPILAGRDFTEEDRFGKELVSIVSQSVAQRLFPNGDAVGPARPADGRWWPAVRPCGGRSLCPRAGGDESHPRDFRGAAGGAPGDTRGRARGSPVAGSVERLCVFRIRRHRTAHRRRGCGGCAGVLGQRAYSRVRRPYGGWSGTTRVAAARALGGRVDCGDRCRGGRGGWLSALTRRRPGARHGAAAWCAALDRRGSRTDRGCRGRVVDAGRACLAGGRGAGTPIGVAPPRGHGRNP
jgi:putative ABC transport system permease protein